MTPAGTPSTNAGTLGSDDPVRFSVRDPSDFVALVPYLLHFHPENSVVVLLLESARLVLTARLDLPVTATVPAVVEEIDYLLGRTGADEFVILGYGSRAEDRAAVSALAHRCGPSLREALWVETERFWSLLCEQPCCPPEGRPYDARAHPLAAAAVWAGLDAGGVRADLAALAGGPTAADQDRLRRRCAVLQRRVGGSVRARQRRLARLVGDLCVRPGPPGVDEALTVALLCAADRVRDVVFTQLDQGSAQRHVELWSAVLRRVPDELASAPLCLLGVAGWLTGNGALLNCCLDRLDQLDPGYKLGELCHEISDAALPPSFWTGLLAELRADPGLRVVPRL